MQNEIQKVVTASAIMTVKDVAEYLNKQYYHFDKAE